MGTFCVYSSDFSGVLCTHRSLPGAVTAIFEVYGTVRSTVGSFFCALLTLLDITLDGKDHVTEVGYIKNATCKLLLPKMLSPPICISKTGYSTVKFKLQKGKPHLEVFHTGRFQAQLPHETKISPYTGRSQPTPGLPMAPGGRYGWEGVAYGPVGP